jgi:hypothetical protein
MRRLLAGEPCSMRTAGSDSYRHLAPHQLSRPILSARHARLFDRPPPRRSLDDIDRLAEAFPPLDAARPTRSDDVPVEALSGAEAERERGSAQEAVGRRALGDDRWMIAHKRACDGCHKADPAGRMGDGAEHGPGQRGVPLFFKPRGK